MPEIGSKRSLASRRPRLAGVWVDCSPVAYYPGIALGVALASVLLFLLGVAR